MTDNPRYVTAAQAGIPEAEQIKIALELILSQGGIAVMEQIYDAVEARMGNGVYLSDQGKHSLRRTINTGAVGRGYIHPYESNSPGWRITDQGIEYIRQELGRPIGRVKVTARAYVNFLLASREIYTLLNFYDQVRQSASGREKSLEIFKKTGIILIITSWETFIEDILESYVNHKLENASLPSQIKEAFDAIANDWYVAIINKHPNRPKDSDFIKWTGDNWKQLIREKFRNDLDSLNTPKSENIRKLSKRYLGLDITSNWRWSGMSSQRACAKLDELIRLRGEVAHRTGNFFEIGSSVRHSQLVSAIEFIEKLAKSTEASIDALP